MALKCLSIPYMNFCLKFDSYSDIGQNVFTNRVIVVIDISKYCVTNWLRNPASRPNIHNLTPSEWLYIIIVYISPAFIDAIIDTSASYTLTAAIKEPSVGSGSSASTGLLTLVSRHALRHVQDSAVDGHLVNLCGVLWMVGWDHTFVIYAKGSMTLVRLLKMGDGDIVISSSITLI